MRRTIVLFLSGLIFGVCVGLVAFRAAEVNFNSPTQESLTTDPGSEDLSDLDVNNSELSI